MKLGNFTGLSLHDVSFQCVEVMLLTKFVSERLFNWLNPHVVEIVPRFALALDLCSLISVETSQIKVACWNEILLILVFSRRFMK